MSQKTLHQPFNPFRIRLHTGLEAETVDGPGSLTGNTQVQDVTSVAPQRQERLRSQVAVMLLASGEERFSSPGTLAYPHPEVIEADEHDDEGMLIRR